MLRSMACWGICRDNTLKTDNRYGLGLGHKLKEHLLQPAECTIRGYFVKPIVVTDNFPKRNRSINCTSID